MTHTHVVSAAAVMFWLFCTPAQFLSPAGPGAPMLLLLSVAHTGIILYIYTYTYIYIYIYKENLYLYNVYMSDPCMSN